MRKLANPRKKRLLRKGNRLKQKTEAEKEAKRVLHALRKKRKEQQGELEKTPPVRPEGDVDDIDFEGPAASIKLAPSEEELEELRADYRRRVIRRIRIRAHAEAGGPQVQQALMKRYADDPIAWINDWVWTYDPRYASHEGLAADWPFDLFPRQEELLRWSRERYQNGEDGVIAKCREVGASWVYVADFVHSWLFEPGFSGGFGSRKELYVKRGSMKSLFGKVEYLLRRLPTWMLPKDFSFKKHFSALQLINPENGASISGEAGNNIGRGDRQSRYLVDEYGFLQAPALADAALSGTTRCTYMLSTVPPEGRESLFGQKFFDPNYPTFVFKWTDDPRKSERWYQAMCTKYRHDQGLVKREVDIDFDAAMENQLCPPAWVKAAVGLALKSDGSKAAGLDVSGGAAENVLAIRDGSVITEIDAWMSDDITQIAWRGCRKAEGSGCTALYYDVVGVGAGVGGALSAGENKPKLDFVPVNGATSATKKFYPDEPRIPANERFINLRAELWWALRIRLLATYERVNGLAWHPDSMCVSLPPDEVLIRQLTSLTYKHTRAGRLQVEAKADLKKRGVPSPDRADAVVYAFAPPEIDGRRVAAVHHLAIGRL